MKTSQAVSAASPKKSSKLFERVLILLAIIGTVAVMSLYQDLAQRYQSHSNPKSSVYGMWVEKDAASYVKDWFELGQNGVTINHRVVATSFDLKGDLITFYSGDIRYQYQVLNKNKTQLQQLSPAHYHPVFELSGKHKKSLR
ncbi:DUF2850 domain-containing protein [Vibrio nomapromontoriensis]|uniref:DUF2850 domain-containing protein n=1 Tax=Vibrio nomapromontoriensis TaxID=2910246 RepID=UPI003D0F3F57